MLWGHVTERTFGLGFFSETKKKKKKLCHSIYCSIHFIAVVWNWAAISPRYACTILCFFSSALLPMISFPRKYLYCVPQILCWVINKLSYMLFLVTITKCYSLPLALADSGTLPRTLIYKDRRSDLQPPAFLRQLLGHCFSALLETQH